MPFPQGWPDGCPPADAEDANGTVYRIVKNNPADEEDFKTHHEAGTQPNAPACLRCGVSVWGDKQAALHMHSLYPKMGDYVAWGMLQPDHGLMKLTGSKPTHTTWWVYDGVERAGIFDSVEEVMV